MFSLAIHPVGSAFEESEPEIARALRVVADRIESGELAGRIRDINGNSVGTFQLTPEEDR